MTDAEPTLDLARAVSVEQGSTQERRQTALGVVAHGRANHGRGPHATGDPGRELKWDDNRVSWRVRLSNEVNDLPRRIGYGFGPRWLSSMRRAWVLLRHRHADVRFLGPVHIGPGFSLHIPHRGSFVVGPGVEFRRGFRAEVDGDGRISIGADSVFTYSVLLQCSTTIDIGKRCALGQSTIVVDGQHRFRDLDRPMQQQGYDFTPIRIGDDATIMSKVTVMASVGERAVVAANAVLTNPAPAYTVMAGVPARPIDYFGPPGEEPPGWDPVR